MSLQAKHFIGSTEIYPENAEEIGFKLDWTKDILEAELTTDAIKLADTDGNPAKSLVLDHIASNGAFEGLPYTVQIGSTIVDYYIDTTDKPKISGEGDSSIEVKIKRRKAVDYFKREANGLTWDLVNTTHPINTFDVDYLIIKDNQLELFITLTIALYNLTKALQEGIRDLVEAAMEVTRAATPDVGVTGPTVQVGDIIAAVVLGVARLLYVAAILVAIIKIVKDILAVVFPPMKQFKAVTVRELFTKGCAKLGYTFSSTISDWDNMTIVGKPTLCPAESLFEQLFTFDSGTRTVGYPTGLAGDSVTTLGQLFDFGKDYCNGKIRIIGNTVHLEERTHWVVTSGITIKNSLNIQAERENQWTYNTGETWKRYYLKYQLDPMDIHTYDNIAGIYSEHSTEPGSVVTNPDLVLIRGLVAKEFPFSFGSRKPGLNFIEKAFLPFAAFGDGVINFFGGSSSFVSAIQGRVGVMQIEKQYFGTTKLLYTVGGRQPANFRDIIGAEAVYQKFHTSNQVKENFKRVYEAEIPFSTQEFENLLSSNYVLDSNGNPLEILNFEFINESKVATIRYAELSHEGFNTKTILIEGGGTSGTTTTNLQC